MKIASISSCAAQTPPTRTSGAIEWIASGLTEQLVEMGHDVTLFATGDSVTRARLWSVFDSPVSPYDRTNELTHVGRACEYIAREGFDIIQNHNYALGLVPLFLAEAPCVTTVHNPYLRDWTALQLLLSRRNHYVSVSESQKRLTPQLDWFGTVHNAVDPAHFPFTAEKGDYLLYLGRINQRKGTHVAIEVAKKAGRRLIIAGPIDEPAVEYYRAEIAPHVDGEQIEYVGEADFERKVELLGRAEALLFTSQIAETFGMVLIEAMACGTPVVSLPHGAAPEVIRDGEVGLIAPDVDGMVAALGRVGDIPRAACRRYVEENFSVQVMARRYVEIYERVLQNRPAPQR